MGNAFLSRKFSHRFTRINTDRRKDTRFMILIRVFHLQSKKRINTKTPSSQRTRRNKNIISLCDLSDLCVFVFNK